MITPAESIDGYDILAISAGVRDFSEEELQTVDELWRDYLNRGAQTSGYYFLVDREEEHVLGYACYGPRALTTWALLTCIGSQWISRSTEKA